MYIQSNDLPCCREWGKGLGLHFHGRRDREHQSSNVIRVGITYKLFRNAMISSNPILAIVLFHLIHSLPPQLFYFFASDVPPLCSLPPFDMQALHAALHAELSERLSIVHTPGHGNSPPWHISLGAVSVDQQILVRVIGFKARFGLVEHPLIVGEDLVRGTEKHEAGTEVGGVVGLDPLGLAAPRIGARGE